MENLRGSVVFEEARPDPFGLRRERLRAVLRSEGLDAFMATTEASCYYFTGGLASRPPGFILIVETGAAVLLVRAVEEAEVARLTSVPILAAGDDGFARASDVLKQIGRPHSRVGFEDASVSVQVFGRWRAAAPGVEFVPSSRIVQTLRAVKDAEEIDEIRAACLVTDRAMRAAIEAIRQGETESRAAAAAESTMREYGMTVAYETLIGSGRRSGLLRRYPSMSAPASDEMVRLDLAARRSYASGYGYHSDMTRSLTLAPPAGRSLDQLNVNLAVQQATLDAIKSGRTIAEVSAEGLREARGTVFDGMVRMAGHGLGLEIHEWPSFNERTEVELLAGMVLAIEPGVRIPGEQATCIEDTVLVTEIGCERLTRLPQDIWND
jgi:Xaa-Pro aminopeptidase